MTHSCATMQGHPSAPHTARPATGDHVPTSKGPLRAVPDAPGGLPPAVLRRIHGHDRAYRRAGEGPPVVLLHGIGDSSTTWTEVFGQLARHHDVIAPDMLGHGMSAKPRADYSLGAFANGVRDLMSVLGIERATIVGHSLGAGVAMQFAYQYAERCDRLVLVGAGGVSRSVSPLLRLASLPTAPLVIGGMELPLVRRTVRELVRVAGRLGTALGDDGQHVMEVLDALPDREARMAFTRTLRAVVDWRGQVVTALDRCYLAVAMPTLLVWGTRDPIIPVHHARIAHAAMPGSRLELFRGVGHFPHRTEPDRFADLLREFVASTEPADWSQEGWRELLRNGRWDPSVVAAWDQAR